MNPKPTRARQLAARAATGLFALSLAVAASAGTYYQENFETYADDAAVKAAGWLINDNSATAECDWTITNPGTRANPIGSSGKFLISDDDFGSPDGDDTNEELISPAFSLAATTTAWLHFATFSEPNDTGETINNVDISIDGGANWTTVWSSASPAVGTATTDDGLGNLIDGNAGARSTPVDVNISTLAAGQANVKIRFHHQNANDDWFWIVDNVVVDDVPPISGTTTILATETFEGEFPPANWRVIRASPDQVNNGTWTRDDGGVCFRNAGGFPGANYINRLGPDHFAILDSDCDPDADPEDEQLWTPTVDCSTFAKVYLHLNSETKFNIGKSILDIDVSRDGGQTFTTVFSYDFRVASPPSLRDNEVYYDQLVVDASIAAGASSVVFRFRNRGNGDEWFWAIDDVKITGTIGTAVIVEPPNQPTLTAPASVSFFSDLAPRSSAFSDPNAGDVHAASTWQISREATFAATTGFANPAIEIRSTNGLTSILIGLSQFAPGSTIYATVQHQDQTGLKSLFAVPQAVTISSLPAPLIIETFESAPDYGVPAGWTVLNHTAIQNDLDDPNDPLSNTYLGFTVVPYETLDTIIGGGRADPNVVSGKSLWAESDKRTGAGAGQQMYAFSPDYSLAGQNNIWLVYKSNYEQNQDNIAALEFSVDQGATWLPVIYMIDRNDIIYAGGNIDANATMTQTQGDAPTVDDGAGGQRASSWSDFIAARPLSNLGPYISGRIDDDPRESRRIERFRLTQADGKATVRFRFAYAGTSSWWWGIDDFSLLSIEPPVVAPEIITPPASQTVDVGASVTLTVSATGTAPLAYAWYRNDALLSTATGSSLTFSPVAKANEGSYVVVVSNSAGSATSTPPAVLTVNIPPPPAVNLAFSQWDFDQGDLRATIGQDLLYRGDTAAATTFETIQIGGQDAKVMKFPAASASQGYVMPHGAVPNGGGLYVNQYTIIYDLMYPAASSSSWRVLFQSNTNNANDGDFFINTANGIGISGSYQGQILADTWHRVAFAVDLTKLTVGKYIDGQLVNQQTLGEGVDGRWSLDPSALLFADQDGDVAVGYVNSIQFHNRTLSTAEIAALGGATAAGIPKPTLTGQWDFDQADLRATIGLPLEFLTDTVAGTTFETLPIGGQDAKVMKFPAATKTQGYVMTHSALPNGGGTNVNQYTVVMDLMFPAASTGKWRGLFQTDPSNGTDGDFFVNSGNGLGISSQYQGQILADTWHRVAFSFDLTKRELRKYIDGVNVVTAPVGSSPGTELAQYLSTTSGIVDNRYSLLKTALLFTDEDGETATGYVNSVQFHGRVLSDSEIARLGSVTATGIPAVIPSLPLRITGVSAVGTTVTIGFTGGVGPYQLQKRATLTDPWQDVGAPATGSSASDTVTGSTAFYRIVGR